MAAMPGRITTNGMNIFGKGGDDGRPARGRHRIRLPSPAGRQGSLCTNTQMTKRTRDRQQVQIFQRPLDSPKQCQGIARNGSSQVGKRVAHTFPASRPVDRQDSQRREPKTIRKNWITSL